MNAHISINKKKTVYFLYVSSTSSATGTSLHSLWSGYTYHQTLLIRTCHQNIGTSTQSSALQQDLHTCSYVMTSKAVQTVHEVWKVNHSSNWCKNLFPSFDACQIGVDHFLITFSHCLNIRPFERSKCWPNLKTLHQKIIKVCFSIKGSISKTVFKNYK